MCEVLTRQKHLQLVYSWVRWRCIGKLPEKSSVLLSNMHLKLLMQFTHQRYGRPLDASILPLPAAYKRPYTVSSPAILRPARQ